MVSSGSGTRVVGWARTAAEGCRGRRLPTTGPGDVVQRFLYGEETTQAKIHRPPADRSPGYRRTMPAYTKFRRFREVRARSELSCSLQLNALVKGARLWG